MSEISLMKSDYLYETNIMENYERLFPQVKQIKVSGLEIKTQPVYHITESEAHVSFSELSYLISPEATVSYGQASTTVMTTPSSVTYEYSPGGILNTAVTTVTKAETESSSPAETTFISTGSLNNKRRETPEEKRAKRLERNRIAVAKYRNKQKQIVKRLQERDTYLTQMNTALRSLIIDLSKESVDLKLQILAHNNYCNCNIVHEYVRYNGTI
ncbi:hypothetical protein RhiirA1_469314 [Rhizophagus irregularis]|uniref:BZIP domain-containing protein n=3 Tax=Rhizophagus irregularis TaxID=588596 RepID=U9SRL6_RHIID|nr:hypothetical protein GLOIN_2v1480793 [Rhizophagus irregularis DAOM 181602=DAOM 197198]EXX63368.1 hypothetical protein RirG_152990 [Rhizophagus irregularis DAOM 197198w]PKC59522.1 hypothetical protein RhiirA1_469314 [Rhizophagus irregularis]PKY19760.1 hypothetical protein RhiirB3_384331 [Rhizophagus irregularis]POG68464.1 hypothetical protein GLOIN_2v1480793 [Rhizophagus irregularis DAOM 181602=DAOM 197198]UZO14574.1 hypothetical protein OCT59_006030 [Rhizophagus irregularis]|eukprot:XP_025175330.1 hypothetical protein GLOIN_2v1480793 [Rhizophagus irregularis DAOM 181602=DAOM 197198]